ncbi:phosphoribosylanthranilate isomerase [Brevibacillus sp. SYSU BS000544]|uniref:phosphoribosylanthranilate isomerase n=1 Tax=Brevibacillus sp. SYSU BS000544 TaxID=3416443 RepID=UPI003CE46B3F
MTVIKICGIKDAKTLELLSDLQVDYAGFVFAPSKRQVTGEHARQLVEQASRYPRLAGVFVNPALQEVSDVLEAVSLDVVQLHGDESTEFIEALKNKTNCQIWKAIRVQNCQQVLEAIGRYALLVDAFLLDAYHPTQAGGTGERFSWEQISEVSESFGDKPFFVAGGISLENVDELLTRYAVSCVDISSGVETDQVKDPVKIRSFVERVRACEASRR